MLSAYSSHRRRWRVGHGSHNRVVHHSMLAFIVLTVWFRTGVEATRAQPAGPPSVSSNDRIRSKVSRGLAGDGSPLLPTKSARVCSRRLCVGGQKQKPDDIPASHNLGIIYHCLRQPQLAIASFQGVLRLDPDHLGALLQLPQLYWQNPLKRHQALAPLQRVLELEPTHPQSSVIKVLIDSLNGSKSPGSVDP